MKRILNKGCLVTVGMMLSAFCITVQAYPPLPHHEIYGMVRTEDGEPVANSSAIVQLETQNGIQVSGFVVPLLDSGINFRLDIPMDAFIEPTPYVPDALTFMEPFKLKVIIGSTTYLPIEMSGDFSYLGQSGKTTRIDLTLGEDSDGDGLPDMWENIVISRLDADLVLSDINPEDDSDQDGMSNLDEYIAGTYAFDNRDFFALEIKEIKEDSLVLEFLAIKGRTYEIKRSTNLNTWDAVSFSVPVVGAELIATYPANNTGLVQVEVPVEQNSNNSGFFLGSVQ